MINRLYEMFYLLIFLILYLDAALTEYVKSTVLVLQDTITQQASNSRNALEVYLWITKSLVLRTHALGYELTENVIQWCGSNIAGSQAPQGFDILIGGDQLALNKTTFATTTILYKQRFFSFCLPKLVEGFCSAEKGMLRHTQKIILCDTYSFYSCQISSPII